MKAASNGTAPLQYDQYDWGDCAVGTKEQLQAIGLGVGLQFPGEVGGPKRKLTTEDPRGFRVVISDRCASKGIFSAYIHFPGWPERPSSEQILHPAPHGLKLKKWPSFDEYTGSADDLIAAGLVRVDQLPGATGMRKTRVTIRADGSVVGGPSTANISRWRSSGARRIEKASTSTFRVSVDTPEEEKQRRASEVRAAISEWQRTVRALPRPMRLDVWSIRNTQTPQQRNHLRLVWSAA